MVRLVELVPCSRVQTFVVYVSKDFRTMTEVVIKIQMTSSKSSERIHTWSADAKVQHVHSPVGIRSGQFVFQHSHRNNEIYSPIILASNPGSAKVEFLSDQASFQEAIASHHKSRLYQ